jgi:Holliday junction resolvase YEN1
MILIGLMSGGDYQQGGLARCGVTTAHALARCGFGDSLYEAAVNIDRESLDDFLVSWRDELRNELRTNSKGEIGKKQVSLANSITENFPDIDILLSYVNPITSESMGRDSNNTKITWEREPDLAKLAGVCELYFEWGYKEAIIKRFRTILWHPMVLRILRRAVLNLDKDIPEEGVPGTPEQRRGANNKTLCGTPSKMIIKHFSSLNISPSAKVSISGSSEEEDEEQLIVKIHSSRTHAFTDGLPEYRLEIAPKQLVLLAESGIKGLRAPEGPNEWSSDEEEENSKKTEKKVPIDPETHLRVWMPACIVKLVEPRVVSDYENIKEQKWIKKTKGNRGAPKKGKAPQKKKVSAVEELLDVFSAPPTKNKSTTVNPPRISNVSDEEVPESDKSLQFLEHIKAPKTLLNERKESNLPPSPTDEESSYEYDFLLMGRQDKSLPCKGTEAPLPEAGNLLTEQISPSSANCRKGIWDLTRKKGQLPTQSGIKSFFPVTHSRSSATITTKVQPAITRTSTNSSKTSQAPIQDISEPAPSSSSLRSSNICVAEESSVEEYDMSIWGRNFPSVPLSPSKRKTREQSLRNGRDLYSPTESEDTNPHMKFRKARTFKQLDRPVFSARFTSRSKKSTDIIEISSESDSEEPLPGINISSKTFPRIKEKETVSSTTSMSDPSTILKKPETVDIIDLT